MGLNATCFVATSIEPMLQGKAFAGPGSVDSFSCLTVPSFLESSSPSSDSSNSSSSTSELFNATELTNEAASKLFERSSGGDAASSILTTTCKYESTSSQLDYHGLSGSPLMNIPSPIFEEEDLAFGMNEVDGISEDLDLDMKSCLNDQVSPSDRYCGRGDSAHDEDILLARVDKFLESDASQEAVGESGLPSMNDLFPDLSMPQDFSLVDDMSTWPALDPNQLQGLESSTSFPTMDDMQAVSSSTNVGGEEESASQMFARWLQSNAHWVSLTDLRRIKLKTSTIENVTKRLGGGKKGLMLFLKFVLIWVQNSRQNSSVEKGAAMVSPSAPLHTSPSPAMGFDRTMAMTMEGLSSMDTLCGSNSPSVLLGAKPHMQTAFSGCGSSPTALSADWTASRAQGAHTSRVHPNISSHASSGYASMANGGACSPLPNTNFYHSNSPWLQHNSNMVRGICPSAAPSLQALPRGSNNRLGSLCSPDVSNMMSMQQRQCTDTTPAATTRAARKSRMERQRWSVRRNRKWAVANQHHRLAAAPTCSGYAQSNVTSWSQPYGNGMQKSSCSSSQLCQQSSKGSNTITHQQSKRPDRNLKLLFHKELKLSDVGSLGRIVLPKAAETCLPPLELRDGVNLVVEDMNSTKVWNMRYRFWPNNKSRMYLLENTSDFVKLYDLKEGDYMMMYLDSMSNRYAIRGVKGSGIQSAALAGRSNNDVHAGGKRSRGLSEEEVNLVSMAAGAMNSEDSGEDSLLVELIEQSLEDFKDS